MGIPSGEEGGIKVQTALSFVYSWLARLGATDAETDCYDEYVGACGEAVKLLDGGALTALDIDAIKRSEPEKFDYDRVMVDEAQDSPRPEVNLVKRLYDPAAIVIADGLDQLVRGERADWLAGIARDDRLVLSLVQCLRMKRNLAVFLIALAERVGLDLDIVPNERAGGGRVVIASGSWSTQRALHDELAAYAAEAKNEPVDSLFCVPDEAISRGRPKRSDVAAALESWGEASWDGVDGGNRRDFPRSTGEYRIVNYKSCRGLEGWNVVLEDLDVFWKERFRRKMEAGLSAVESEQLHDLDELARVEAWRWCFIALTRPIDTLVITLADPASTLGRAVLAVAENFPDVVESRLD
jgi:hypothetical protein